MKPKTQEEQAKYSLGKVADGKQQSDSKRLRNVLYILYTQNNENFVDFTSYYQAKMNDVINNFKALIIDKGEETKEDKQSEVTQTA